MTLSEEFVGRLSFVSRLPQYLVLVRIDSLYGSKVRRVLANLLDDSNVDGGSGTGPIYLWSL